MRRASSINIEPLSNKVASYWYCLLLTIIIGVLCIPCALYMIWMPDERLKKINLYNDQAVLWNNTYLQEIKNSSFSLTVNKCNFLEQVNETASGTYYPYRDTCSKPNDPQCVSPNVYYKSFSVPSHISNTLNIVLTQSISNGKAFTLLNTTIPLMKNITLTVEQLGCNPNGNTCLKRCQTMSGYWINDYNICVVESFLNRICMRIHMNETHFVLDDPPLYPMKVNSDIGCEMFLPNNTLLLTESTPWLPFYYTTRYVTDIPFILYHAGDAYIRAGAITDNCSSSHLESANCFQRGKADYKISIIFFLLFGLVSVVTIIVLFVLYKTKKISISIWDNYLSGIERRMSSTVVIVDIEDDKEKTLADYPPADNFSDPIPCDEPNDDITPDPTGI